MRFLPKSVIPSRRLCLPLLVLVLVVAGFAARDVSLTEQYKTNADRLIDLALADDEGYAKLAYLCDRIGNRLSGSPALEKAIAWSAEQMKRDGLSNVRVLPVKVPHWVRGAESARMLTPVARPLPILGLGMSIGTPPGGITADVVVVSNFDELTKLGKEKVQGKIVVYNQPYEGYGRTVVYRSSGASRAAALGAVAALVRAVTPLAMQQPHTGAMRYDPAQPKIPAASITPEDAMMLARLTAQDVPVKVHLEMEAHMEPDADSANVIGEIPGRDHPDEVVVLGGHIDSWDVGQGAQDDGSGIMASLQAVALIKKAGLQPSLTIRVAFWVNEENGSKGGQAYRDWSAESGQKHVAAIEMDGGAEPPRGFGFGTGARPPRGPLTGPPPQITEAQRESMAMLQQIGKLLDRIEAGAITPGGGGADIAPLMAEGVPGLGLRTTGDHYFDWHHTHTDTLDKVDPIAFRKNVAALAVMAYILADMPAKLVGAASR